jgi:hypothetical protein
MSDDLSALYARPLADLGLSEPLLAALGSADLPTVGDLVELMYQGPAALIEQTGLGPTLMEELIDALRAKNIIQ